MFSSKEFIEISRRFVCVRIDSYESEEHQQWVRRLLRGRFANTAFCVLTPDGNDWITGAGRSPRMVFGDGDSVRSLANIASEYPARFDQSQAVVQDFHSVAQALNVASADQRVLVLVAGPEEKLNGTRRKLRPVINHPQFLGRFHVDFESDSQWEESIIDETSNEGIMLIAASEFGLSGKVLQQVSLDVTQSELQEALANANAIFSDTTKKKDYTNHVRRGRRLGIRYESVVPFGEDRDADGQIDVRKRRPRRSR